MRRLLILGLLLVGMQLLVPIGVERHGSVLLAFGFLVLAAYTSGEMFASMRMPKIVGYLVAGMLFGPSIMGVVDSSAVSRLEPVASLAIALIAFLAGAELRWSEVRERGRAIMMILGTELTMTFVLVAGAMIAASRYIPFFENESFKAVVGFSILFASIAVVHSPAVTMALLTETRARGPVARTTLGVVLVSDVVVIVLFSAALAVARVLAPPQEGVSTVGLSEIVWEIGGSVLVGAAIGLGVAALLLVMKRELGLFAIVMTFLAAELARLSHVDVLLALLVAGFVTENVSGGRGEKLRHAMERSAAPVLVVFFALAGAGLALRTLSGVWWLVIPVVLIRALGIWAGCRIGVRWAGIPPKAGDNIWMGLVAQAGVAIGLAAVVTEVYPERGAPLQALFLGVLAVNQLLGPILFRRALASSGEIPNGDGDIESEEAEDSIEEQPATATAG